MVYPDQKGLAGWVRTTWLPYIERVPEALRPEFVDEIVCRYISRYPAGSDGTIRVAMVRLEIEAKKP